MGNDYIALLFPELFDSVHAVGVLYIEKGRPSYHPHVHESEEQCHLCIIIPREEDIHSQLKSPTCIAYFSLDCELQFQTM